MGKRSAVVELFLGNMGSIQREIRPFMQREDPPTMETKLEQIAAKARCEPKLRFTSLAHHITRDRVLKALSKIPNHSAAGVPCSFGGRPGLSAHHALATLTEVIAGGKTGWVLEADLKNFFGSLSHKWLIRFVEHRVGDPRLISLIRRWLKAGVL